jgi:hypothetical protein
MTRALSLNDVCRRLSLGETAVRVLLPKMRAYKAGGVWRVDESDLDAFIESRKAAQQPRLSEAAAVRKAFDPDDALPEVPAECLL